MHQVQYYANVKARMGWHIHLLAIRNVLLKSSYVVVALTMSDRENEFLYQSLIGVYQIRVPLREEFDDSLPGRAVRTQILQIGLGWDKASGIKISLLGVDHLRLAQKLVSEKQDS